MIQPLQVLLVADTEAAEPALHALRRVGYDPRPRYASSPSAVGVALEAQPWDIVLLGPGEVGVRDALGWLQRYDVSVPVFVTADMEDEADLVALLEDGARDVIGLGRIDRLGVAVARALRDRRGRETGGEASRAEAASLALAQHMPIGVYRSTEDGRILFANPALARMLGYEAVEDVLGEPVIGDALYPREAFARQIAETGEVRDLVMEWERSDGRPIVTRETARTVYDPDGVFLYYEGTMEDITEEHRALGSERRRVEQLEALVAFSAAADAAESAEELGRAIVRAVASTMRADAAALIVRHDDEDDVRVWASGLSDQEVERGRREGVWASCARETERLLIGDIHTERVDPIPDSLLDLTDRGDFSAMGCCPLVRHGQPGGTLVVFFRAPTDFSDDALRMADTLAWYVASALGRWQAESELRASEATLRTIADVSGRVPYRLRFDGDGYDFLDSAVEHLTGYAPSAFQAAGGLDGLTETYRTVEGHALKKGQPDAAERYVGLHHLRTARGEVRWIEDSAYPWVDEHGQMVGLVGMLQDVTERIEREAAAQEQSNRSLAQQRTLSELATLSSDADSVLRRATELAAHTMSVEGVGLWVLNAEKGMLESRPRYVLSEGGPLGAAAPDVPVSAGEQVLGTCRVLAVTDLSEQTAASELRLGGYFGAADVRAALFAPIRREGAVVGFLTFEHDGLSRTWTLDEQDFAGAVADLTALTLERQHRAQAEEALRESERRYRAISAIAADYAYALRVEADGTSSIEWATNAFARISGYTPDEVAGASGLLALVHPDDRRTCLRSAVTLLAGGTVDAEVRIRTKEGEERWVRHRSRPERDAEGLFYHIYSTGQDITERKRFEAALVEAREAAEGMARNKSAFLANMSHEIRTPLTGIIGFASVLAEDVEEEHREYAQLIERSSLRLLGTINSVLDLAQLESEGLEPALEALDVADEAQQAALLLTRHAENEGLALRIHTPDEPAIAFADPMCLHRVLNNLIGNAIKFTEAGEVEVEVRTDADHVLIEVRDTGIGIDAEFLPHLFSEFRRESSGQEQAGSGLGLAITKRLVELMGGTVTVESERGVGSTFTIALPREPADGAERSVDTPADEASPDEEASANPAIGEDGYDEETADEIDEGILTEALGMLAVPSRSDYGDPVGDGSPADSDQNPVLDEPKDLPTSDEEDALSTVKEALSSPPSEPVPEPAEPPVPHSELPALLLITDDAELRGRIRQALEGAFVVDAAEDARSALDRMARSRYDGLLLDIHLGGKQTGIGVLRVARTLPGYESVFVVALASDEIERDPYLDAGFDRVLSGTLTSATLQRALHHVSARAAARRASRPTV